MNNEPDQELVEAQIKTQEERIALLEQALERAKLALYDMKETSIHEWNRCILPRPTELGFQYGQLNIMRAASNRDKGWAMVLASTPKHSLVIYANEAGEMRLYDGNKWWSVEWQEGKQDEEDNDSL